MNILKFKFPKNANDNKTMDALLREAKLRGFYDNPENEYVQMFSDFIFLGGTLVIKNGLPPSFVLGCEPYIKSLMKSRTIKHEHKEAICAMLLNSLTILNKPKEESGV